MTNPQDNNAPEDNLLAKIESLSKDTAVQIARIKSLHRAGKLTPEVLTSEVVETLLPLLADTQASLFEVQYVAQEFGHEVSDKLWPDGDDEGGIWPDDAELFTHLLTEYRDLLTELLPNMEPERQAAAAARVEAIGKALERIGELTLDEDDEDAEDEENEEDESAN